jgi:hypothetical protein
VNKQICIGLNTLETLRSYIMDMSLIVTEEPDGYLPYVVLFLNIFLFELPNLPDNLIH